MRDMVKVWEQVQAIYIYFNCKIDGDKINIQQANRSPESECHSKSQNATSISIHLSNSLYIFYLVRRQIKPFSYYLNMTSSTQPTSFPINPVTPAQKLSTTFTHSVVKHHPDNTTQTVTLAYTVYLIYKFLINLFFRIISFPDDEYVQELYESSG